MALDLGKDDRYRRRVARPRIEEYSKQTSKSYRGADQVQSDEQENTGSIAVPKVTNLTLPVDSNQLGTFLASLLGQPQSLEGSFYQPFDINHDWLLNLHEVLNQRIYQQANAELLTFRATVYFENQLKRTLTTIEAFQTYQEMQQQRSIGVQLEWAYMVQFPNSDVPEKQHISFVAQAEPYSLSRRMRQPDRIIRLFFPNSLRANPHITYRIDYTERTWGNDIETLVRDTVDSAARPEKQKNRFAYLRLGLALLLFACSIYTADLLYDYHEQVWVTTVEQKLAELKKLGPATLEILDTKLLRIGEFALTGISVIRPNSGIFAIFSMFGVFLAAIMFAFTEYSQQSFVVLTKPAETARSQRIRKENRNALTLVWGYITAIGCSIIAAFIFEYLV